MMKTRQLGHSDLHVSIWCFGGNVFGWTLDEKASFQILDAFLGAGGNFIDTADVYSKWIPGNQGGESETIIGKWMKARNNRDKVILATKVGMEMTPDKPDMPNKGLSKKYIFQAVEDSLKRLQTDHIDLYISHKPDPSTPIEETLEAYQQLIKDGKIRYCGASNYSANELKEALAASRKNNLPEYQSLQPLYNLYDREFEKELAPVCREFGLGVTPFFALASGFLTGKYRSENDLKEHARGERVRRYLDDRGLRILKALDEVAETHNTSLAAVAVSWLMSRPTVTSAIASATKTSQIEDLVAATQLDLDQASLAILDQASAL